MNRLFKYMLFPFSVLYGSAVFIRNKLFDLHILKSHTFNTPIISVGNITVGGTGKTPHVEYLISILKDEYKIAVLSRGYKRKSKGFFLADKNSTAEKIGDEPMQIYSKFQDVIVAVDSNRVRGIQNLLRLKEKIDVVILDDAFQHRYVTPGLSILLIDYNRPLNRDRLLPSGRLREPAASLKRAEIILYTKSPEGIKASERRSLSSGLHLQSFQYLYFTRIVADEPLPVFSSGSKIKFPEKDETGSKQILLIAGIANPENVKNFARSYSSKIREMYFPDHHTFSHSDIRKILQALHSEENSPEYILTTEKDAMRLRKFEKELKEVRDRIFYIPIRIEFIDDKNQNFNNQIIGYVRNNKRNS